MLAVLAALVLAAPQAAAHLATLDAASLAGDGSISMNVGLAALHVFDPVGDPRSNFAPTDASIVASRISTSVDWWRFSPYLLVDAEPLSSNPIDVRQTSVGDQRGTDEGGPYRDVVVRLGAPGGDFDLHVLPLASGARLEASFQRVELGPASAAQHRVDLEANQTRMPPVAPLDGALEQTTPAGVLRVEGSFMVALWAWNAQLSSPDGDANLTSGQRAQSTPVNVAGRVAMQQNVLIEQVFLMVEDGVMVLPIPEGAQARLYGVEPHLAGLERLELTDATGALADGKSTRDVASQKLTLEGVLSVQAGRPHSNGVPVAIDGTVRAATSDGSDLAWVAPIEPVSWWASNLALVALGLVAGGPAAMGAVAARRRLLLARMARVDDGLQRRDYAEVLANTGPLMRARAFRAEAVAVQVEALVGLGRAPEAVRVLDTLDPRSSQAPLQHYLRAYALAAAGAGEDAATHLEIAVGAAPALLREAQSDPILAPLTIQAPPGRPGRPGQPTGRPSSGVVQD